MRNMAFAKVGSVVIAIHTDVAPSEEEWAEYIKLFQTLTPRELMAVRAIAFTDGGAPDSRQRKILNDLLKGRPGTSAVVSSSAMVRSVVTALTWFNPLVKAFAPERAQEAYTYLKLSHSETVAVQQELMRLRKTFSVPLRCLVD